MSTGNYTRTPASNTSRRNDIGPYEAIVVNNMDVRYMGSLEVELLKYTSAGGTPERSGQLIQVRYLSPFYGVTPSRGLTANDGYQHTQKSYGFWGVPPDVGTKVLVIFAEGNLNFGYWIGCIPADYMNFMVPDGRASTENTTDATPDQLKGKKLPVGEYNKLVEDGSLVDPTLFNKPYNKDFVESLEIQGLLNDEIRGTTTTSARREIPSMVFGLSTPGPRDKRDGAPTHQIGPTNLRANVPYNRLGGTSFVMDDGDERYVRASHAESGPPIYKNVLGGETDGDPTIPQNELTRWRTRTGHQILMHNSEDLIYIGNARGTTWIEMTSDGKIDIHAQDSVSIMTVNDLNITAERDINMEAGRNINMKATARYSDGSPNDNQGNDSGRIHFEAQYDYRLRVGRDQKITVIKNSDTRVGEVQKNTTGKTHHIKSGRDNRLTAGGYTHIKSGKEHRETATYIHMNGPGAAPASAASTVAPLPTITLPYTFPGIESPVPYESILTRAPQHEPWTHHENMDPLSFKKSQTDRESPGGLRSADRVITPDTFNKNLGGRTTSGYATGSGGSISSGVTASAGGAASGTGQTPRRNYSSDFEYSDELGSLSARYESRGDPTVIGWDSTGGHSYGTYQIAANTGAFDDYMSFLNQTHPETYALLQQGGGAQAARAGTDSFYQTWRTVMADPRHAETQHDFGVQLYFVPAANLVTRNTGLDVRQRSKTMQDVLWSTAIQHGNGGASRIFQRAIERTGTSNPTDQALINAIYDERGANNGNRYFGGSTASVRQSVVNRFNNERSDALTSLEQEQAVADVPTSSPNSTSPDLDPDLDDPRNA